MQLNNVKLPDLSLWIWVKSILPMASQKLFLFLLNQDVKVSQRFCESKPATFICEKILITGNNHELLRNSIKSVFLFPPLEEDCLYILNPSSFIRNTMFFHIYLHSELYNFPLWISKSIFLESKKWVNRILYPANRSGLTFKKNIGFACDLTELDLWPLIHPTPYLSVCNSWMFLNFTSWGLIK